MVSLASCIYSDFFPPPTHRQPEILGQRRREADVDALPDNLL